MADRTTEDAAAPIARGDVEAAYERIRRHLRRTPTIDVDIADFAGAPVGASILKLEFLQHSGSFKARGAFANLLLREPPGAGVVAASGGNHGAAVAFAARRLGVPATIFVPSVASPAKLEQIRSYGADLRVGGDRYDDALRASIAHQRETGALSAHAFDQDETLMGQGSVALEFAEQASPDTILVATGGGGLLGGMAAYLEGRIRLVAVEPETAPSLYNARAAGRPIDAPAGGVAADSLAPKRIGEKAYGLAERFVERAVLVSDQAIVDAQAALWKTLRVVVEPGGAAALAALLSGAYRPEAGERVGVLLCGANTTAVDFSVATAAAPAGKNANR